jgi:outer membrane protein assembly factor BamB
MNSWNFSRRTFLASSVGALLSARLPAQDNQQRTAAAIKVADPKPFTSQDGKIKGWRLTVPGNRPLATPAIVNGKVFLGGGFGSHEFYAFDAITGKQVWQYRTSDDGPTAAVVEDGFAGSLDAWINRGGRNAAELYRDLVCQGCQASYDMVRR